MNSYKNLMIVFLLIITALSSISAVDNYNCPMGGYGSMMAGSYGFGGLFFGWITSILIIVLIIAAIYWLVKSAGKK